MDDMMRFVSVWLLSIGSMGAALGLYVCATVTHEALDAPQTTANAVGWTLAMIPGLGFLGGGSMLLGIGALVWLAGSAVRRVR